MASSADRGGPPGSAPVNPLSDPEFLAGLRPIPSGPVDPDARRPAADIYGIDPSGCPVEVVLASFSGPVLLCFLHVRCDGCEEFWRGLRDDQIAELPFGTSPVAVSKGPASVNPDEVAGSASGVTAVPVVMSDPAWDAYRVTGYPFFALVDPVAGLVVGETIGFGWSDVRSMIEASWPERPGPGG